MKKIIDYFVNLFHNNKVFNFITRHFVVIGILAVCIIVVALPDMVKFVLTITALECLALLLSGLALFAYTNLNFTKKISFGDDGKVSGNEIFAFQRVIGNTFIAVHTLVGIGSMLYYADLFKG